MKKIIQFTILLPMLLLQFACDKGLSELNENKTNPIAIDPVFQLNNAVINLSFPVATLVYEMGIVQQMISPNGGVLAGANFNQDNRSPLAPVWQAYYRNVIRNTRDVIGFTKEMPTRTNLMNMGRILQAYAFMVLTDTYGDIPYAEGGLGYTEQLFLPKYDAQQAIYTDIIKELTEASAALDATKPTEAGDILYGGNISQWKKFGFALLLRAGMRITKADAAKAEAAVKAAFAGGVITANTDNAIMRHDANYLHPIGNTLNGTEGANFFLAKPFVDQLKNTNDPRLSAIAIRYVGAKSGPEQTPAVGTTDPTRQIGMPMGKDNGTAGAAATADGLASYYEYSQADRRRLTKGTAPAFFVTAGQSLLLLAEAAQRGWVTAGTAKSYYDLGVTAHMQEMATHDANAAVPAGAITTYLAANPFSPATAMQQIGTQYWIASFLNGSEAWANFRRTGFPALPANPYVGDIPAGTFIRRITYPVSEISANTTNVNEAIARQGADKMDTRMWWDK
ncbi:MAG: SusD/RagB family nutrient-binding outer membrane lipoprotein [Chitinophagaceae bacterium]|nr:MAG: SusD/RagB family nutrient-binding outer membrane lipoprotein [Chitinophagaceae bacterium]